MASTSQPDQTPSKRLFIIGLATYTKRRDLAKIFENYQPRSIIIRKGRGYQNTAFVDFRTSEEAVEAMKGVGAVTLKKRKLTIKFSDPWEELRTLPSCKRRRPLSMVEDPLPGFVPKEAKQLSIKCICEIARYLPYKERARMERVCKQWRIGSRNSHTYTKTVTPTSWEWKDGWNHISNSDGLVWIIKRGGEYLTSLDLEGITEIKSTAITMAAKEGRKLEILKLTTVSIRGGALRSVSDHLYGLRELEIGKCVGPIDWEIENIILKNVNLKKLILQNNEITGKGLGHKTSIKELHMKDCDMAKAEGIAKYIQLQDHLEILVIINCLQLRRAELFMALTENSQTKDTLRSLRIHGDGLSDAPREDPELAEGEERGDIIELDLLVAEQHLASALQSLHELSVTACGWVDADFIRYIGEGLAKLSSLHISMCTNIRGQLSLEPLAQLKHVRVLKLNNMYPTIGGSCLKTLELLENLEIRENQGIYDEDICGMLRTNHVVQHIDIEGCWNITQQTITVAQEVVRMGRRQQPLHLYAGGTQATPSRRDRRNTYLRISFKRYATPLVQGVR
ncbi:uncharacterized protein [Neodiprion pinetum]|uniref:uncharacterized protein n=1 Tax=Neodiprion pinetum TaxID=441929 RepID=UPI003722C8A6